MKSQETSESVKFLLEAFVRFVDFHKGQFGWWFVQF